MSAAANGPIFNLKCVLCKKTEKRLGSEIPSDGPMCKCGGVMTAERAATLHLKAPLRVRGRGRR